MTSGGRTSQRPARARAGQQGLALVLLLALVSMGALYMLVAQLGRATQRADRDLVTMSVLSEAKQALIGYAAREKRLRPRSTDRSAPPPGHPDPTTYYYSGSLIAAYGATGTDIDSNDRPGSLPCPAPDESGIAVPAVSCASASTGGGLGGEWKNRVGFLPWRTLGIPPLRDADGALLMYAVSDNFRNDSANAINSRDTAGQLSLVGSGTPVIAVVIAPGQPLTSLGQDRSVSPFRASDYLEGANNSSVTPDDKFEMRVPCLSGPPSCPALFNDTLVTITADDLWPVVENEVALRMQLRLVPVMAQFYGDKGALPFPSDFLRADPTDFSGTLPSPTPGTDPRGGHLPVPTLGTVLSGGNGVEWGAFTVVQLVSPSYGAPGPNQETDPVQSAAYDPPANAFSPATPCTLDLAKVNLTCTFATVTGTPRLKIATTVQKGALAFLKQPASSSSGSFDTPVGGRIQLQSDGNALFEYKVQLDATAFASDTIRTLTVPLALEFAKDTSTPDLGWFFRNGWYKLTYYAVSPSVLPDTAVASDCTPPATPPYPPLGDPTVSKCLKAQPASGPTHYMAKSVLVLAGRQTFKSDASAQGATLAEDNFLEGMNNAGPSNYTYEEQRRRDLPQPPAAPLFSFNDRLVTWPAKP
jgi:hypothetical protein